MPKIITQHRRGTTAEWLESEIVLAQGEIGIEECDDSFLRLKIGNGYSTFSELPYVTQKVQEDINVANSRIDNIVKINEGEITSEDPLSEIVDIRTGYDGVSYTTAGNAVRAVGEDISNLRTSLQQFINADAVDGLYYENNMLYLTANGQPLMDTGVEVIGGSGGGGTSSSTTIKLTNNVRDDAGQKTNNISVAKGNSITLLFTYISEEDGEPTGDGSCTIQVDGVVRKKLNIKQGDNEIDITDIISSGQHTVRVSVSDIYGNSRNIVYTINVIELVIRSTFNAYTQYSKDIDFRYRVIGFIDKTVHFELDGKPFSEVKLTAASSNKETSLIIPIAGLTHGVHKLVVYATSEYNGTSIPSNMLRYDVMIKLENETAPMIASILDVTEIKAGDLLSIPYVVYDPTSPECENVSLTIKYLKDGVETVYGEPQIITVDKSIQNWNTRSYPVGDSISFIISYDRNGSLNPPCQKVHTIKVSESDVVEDAETDNLVLYLSAKDRDNKRQDRDVWEYDYIDASGDVKTITTTFDNFNWKSNGWVPDDRLDSCLRINGGAKATIDFSPFAGLDDALKSHGFTIEFEFAVRDVNNRDTVIINCYKDELAWDTIQQEVIDPETGEAKEGPDGLPIYEYVHVQKQKPIGLKATSDTASLCSRYDEVSCNYKELEKVRLSFVIDANEATSDKFVYSYLDGVLSSVYNYNANDTFGVDNKIVIGDIGCTIDLYTIRVYNKALTAREILKNYIADTTDAAIKSTVYLDNAIYDDNGQLSYEAVKDNIPTITFTGAMPAFKGDKKIVYMDFVNPFDHSKDFSEVYKNNKYYIEGQGIPVQIDVQGTSSQYYVRKNWKIKLGYDADGNKVKDFPAYQHMDNELPAKVFCIKVDYAEGTGTHNTQNANFAETLYYEKVPAQYDTPEVRTTITGFPCVIFESRDAEDGGITYAFSSKGNFNFDKDAEDAFGFNKKYDVECWEFCNNTSNYCRFLSPIESEEYWLGDFEPRYTGFDFEKLEKLEDAKEKADENGQAFAQLEELKTARSEMIARFKRMHDWVVSTKINDLSNDEEVEQCITEFKNNFTKHFDMHYSLIYYIYTFVALMVDQRAKNMFLTFWADRVTTDDDKQYVIGGQTLEGVYSYNVGKPYTHLNEDGTETWWVPAAEGSEAYDTGILAGRWRPYFYDNDTSWGINNTGYLTFDYYHEDIDKIGGVNVYNGQDSTLWVNFRLAFQAEIAEMYSKLRSEGKLTYDAIINQFIEAGSSHYSASIYNEDAEYKYMTMARYQPDGTPSNPSNLYQIKGNGEHHLKYFVENRLKYCDSKWNVADYAANFIDVRVNTPDKDNPTINVVPPTHHITVTPYSNMYCRVKYGTGKISGPERLEQNQAFKFGTEFNAATTVIALNPTTLYKVAIDDILSGKTLYLTGEILEGKLVTTENLDDAISIYAEEIAGNYKLYSEIEGVKKYLDIYLNADQSTSFQFTETSNCTYRYDNTSQLWVTTLNDVDYYLAAENESFTVAAFEMESNITNIEVTQFPCYFINPEETENSITFNDSEVQVFGASEIRDLGDLSPLYLQRANFENGIKLTNLKIGNKKAGYDNANMKQLSFGNNTLLRELDISNCSKLGTEGQDNTSIINLSGCLGIEKIYAHGTILKGIILPEAGYVKELYLPGTIVSLNITNQANLEDEGLKVGSAVVNPTTDEATYTDFYGNIVDLTITGCPKLNTINILNKCLEGVVNPETGVRTINLKGVNIDNVSWTVSDWNDIRKLYLPKQENVENGTYIEGSNGNYHKKITSQSGVSYIDTYIPFDAGYGYELRKIGASADDLFDLTIKGTCIINQNMIGEEMAELVKYLPNLKYTMGDGYTLTSEVIFRDNDENFLGSIELHTSSTENITCPDPTTADSGCKDQNGDDVILAPTHESSIAYDYEFNGWSRSNNVTNAPQADALSNVLGNRILYPTFKQIARKYPVEFYNADTFLEIVHDVEFYNEAGCEYPGDPDDVLKYPGDPDASEFYPFVAWLPQPILNDPDKLEYSDTADSLVLKCYAHFKNMSDWEWDEPSISEIEYKCEDGNLAITALAEGYKASLTSNDITYSELEMADNVFVRIPAEYTVEKASYPVTSVNGFANCDKIDLIDLPITLERIETQEVLDKDGKRIDMLGAFYGCKNLEEITIPENVNYLGAHAFAFTDLRKVNYRATNANLNNTDAQNNQILEFSYSPFKNCVSELGFDLTVGNNVKQIPAYMFNNSGQSQTSTLRMMNKINWEENSSCTEIGQYAFRGTNMAELTLPNSLELIRYNAFQRNNTIETLVLPETTKPLNIESGAFSEWLKLKRLEIPSNVSYIQGDAFTNLPQLEEIVCSEDNSNYSISGKCLVYTDSNTGVKTLVKAVPTGTISSDIKILGNSCFDYLPIENIVIPDTVEKLDICCFRNCQQLKTVKLSKQIETISAQAFYYCESLHDINIPESVKVFETNCFTNAKALTAINIPEATEAINDSAFRGCSSLTTVTFGDNSKLTTIQNSAFRNCTNLTTISIPNSVTTIGTFGEGTYNDTTSGAFNNSGLTEIRLGSNISNISEHTFVGCKNLSKIYIAKSRDQWPAGWETKWGAPSTCEIIQEEPEIPVEIYPKTLRIISNPTKTAYAEGETFDPNGLVVEADMTDGQIYTVTDAITYDTGKLIRGTDLVKLSYTYNGKTITIDQDIFVNPINAHNAVYAQDSTSQTVAIQIPQTVVDAAKVPVVVTIHGGGWAGGDPSQYTYISRYINDCGCVHVNIGYRLTTGNPRTNDVTYKDMLEDIQSVLTYLDDNKDIYHIDMDNIALMGYSAGAHLAMLYGYKAANGDYNYGPNIKLVVSEAGPTYFVNPADDTLTQMNNEVCSMAGLKHGAETEFTDSDIATLIDASPYYIVENTEYKEDLPYTFLVYGNGQYAAEELGFDFYEGPAGDGLIPYVQATDLQDLMLRLGLDKCDLKTLTNALHTDFGVAIRPQSTNELYIDYYSRLTEIINANLFSN